MKAVLQRVGQASVTVNGEVVGEIGAGLLVFVGVEAGDEPADAEFLAGKISRLRIFQDKAGKMNLSLAQIGGGILVVSQFTLCADVAKGNRPSFSRAAKPAMAKALYLKFCEQLRGLGLAVATGEFAASMAIRLINDGPVTICLDSNNAAGGMD